jgi:hypothetical protein
MVTVAVLFAPSVAPPLGAESVTVNVSGSSSLLSARIGTVIVFVVSPIPNASVPAALE